MIGIGIRTRIRRESESLHLLLQHAVLGVVLLEVRLLSCCQIRGGWAGLRNLNESIQGNWQQYQSKD